MMRKVVVAATQMSCTWDREATLAKAEKLVREAALKGANIILLQELFETPYFCQRHDFEYMDLATTPEENPAVKRFQEVAKELDVVIPVSFFERAGNAAFNSIAIIDADGTVLGNTERPIFRTGCLMQRSFSLLRAIPDLRSGKQSMEPLVWGSAGISGFRKLPDAWRFWARRSCFTPLLSAVSRFFRRIPNRTGRDVCRGMRLQISCL